MKFEIRRASYYGDTAKPPHGRAYSEIKERVYNPGRSFQEMTDYWLKYKPEIFFMENGELKQRVIDYTWYIEINTLDELMNLCEEEGELIIDSDSIMIYDTYVE